MGIFGKILATPIRIANLPLRIPEKLIDEAMGDEGERVLSAPLEAVAKAVEEVDGDDR